MATVHPAPIGTVDIEPATKDGISLTPGLAPVVLPSDPKAQIQNSSDNEVWINIVGDFMKDKKRVMKKAYKESLVHTKELISNKYLMGVATLIGDFLLSIILSSVGVGAAYLYASFSLVLPGAIFNQLLLLLIVIAPIFTVWNIAQYASFALQTTGHIWPRNHWWAIKDIGPYLLVTNIGGWCLIILAYFTWDTSAVPPVVVHVPILAFAILTGIWLKTDRKVGYAVNKFQNRKLAERKDAYVSKTYAMVANINATGALTCPFAVKTNKAVAIHAMGPTLCFLWTAVYTIGLGLLYNVSEHIAFKWFLFVLALGVHYLGNRWLGQLIKNAVGMMMYSKKMIVVFYYIYGMVSCSQIRLVVTKFDGGNRVAAGILFALFSFSLRLLTIKKLRLQYNELTDLSTQVQEQLAKEDTPTLEGVVPATNNRKFGLQRQMTATRQLVNPFVDASRSSDQFVISLVVSLITQNTCTIVTAGLSCAFAANEVLTIGLCNDGFFMQAILDMAPLIAFDVIEVVLYAVVLTIPTIHMFLQFDWFMVVAAVLVSYLNVIVIIWALSPMFSLTPFPLLA